MKIYLAGPEVFLPDAEAVFDEKRAICERHNCKGMSPLDNALDLVNLSKHEAARAIYNGNEEMMRTCDSIIANVTPFRGISADVGTVYEVGFMAALGKPVFAYSNLTNNYVKRVRSSIYFDTATGLDIAGTEIEDFDLLDNLMIPLGIEQSGGKFVVHEVADEEFLYRDLTAFEKAVSLISML